jgi:hypothetical protein
MRKAPVAGLIMHEEPRRVEWIQKHIPINNLCIAMQQCY